VHCDRIDTGYVITDHTGSTAIGRDRGAPLGFGQALSIFRQGLEAVPIARLFIFVSALLLNEDRDSHERGRDESPTFALIL
jgi:hypothetical protein